MSIYLRYAVGIPPEALVFSYEYCFGDFRQNAHLYDCIQVYVAESLSEGAIATVENGAAWLRSKGFDVQLVVCNAPLKDDYSCNCSECQEYKLKSSTCGYALSFNYTADMPQDAIYFVCSHMRFLTDEFSSVIPENMAYFDYLRGIFGDTCTTQLHMPIRVTNYFLDNRFKTENLLAIWDKPLTWEGPALKNSTMWRSSLDIRTIQEYQP